METVSFEVLVSSYFSSSVDNGNGDNNNNLITQLEKRAADIVWNGTARSTVALANFFPNEWFQSSDSSPSSSWSARFAALASKLSLRALMLLMSQVPLGRDKTREMVWEYVAATGGQEQWTKQCVEEKEIDVVLFAFVQCFPRSFDDEKSKQHPGWQAGRAILLQQARRLWLESGPAARKMRPHWNISDYYLGFLEMMKTLTSADELDRHGVTVDAFIADSDPLWLLPRTSCIEWLQRQAYAKTSSLKEEQGDGRQEVQTAEQYKLLLILQRNPRSNHEVAVCELLLTALFTRLSADGLGYFGLLQDKKENKKEDGNKEQNHKSPAAPSPAPEAIALADALRCHYEDLGCCPWWISGQLWQKMMRASNWKSK